MFHGLLYAKSKGLAEEAVRAAGFESAAAVRPGLLNRGDRARTGERLFGWLMSWIDVSQVARAMLATADEALSGARGGWSVLEGNATLRRVGAPRD